MRTLSCLAFACAMLAAAAASASQGEGYPSRGKAIDELLPASDYSDVLANRPRAVGIMRSRGQGFVPSPELTEYAQSVLDRLLRGVPLPPSFHPQVRILATPEFAGECTPDGTLVITVGLLELLENEDELAFVLGHEVSHAIYRHQVADWYKKAQFYAVVNGAAVDVVALSAARSIGGHTGDNILRGLDVAQHLAKLSANVLMPQMAKDQEDAADALGFDLMVRAGYDPDASLAVMDKLGEQEAEAEQAAAEARQAAKTGGSGGGFTLGKGFGILGTIASGGRPSKDQIADIAIFAFDSAVDSMADDATTHHPAREREDLLSDYEYREYRVLAPVTPTPLPWDPASRSPLKPHLVAMLGHYTQAENAAAYIADRNQGTDSGAHASVVQSVAAPTEDHAYTEFVASEYYDNTGQKGQSEAALVKAVQSPEPSWEVYSRLIDIYMQKAQYPKADALMAQAVTRFEDSPVLLPKRIALFRTEGRQSDAQALIPECKNVGIDELTDECKKAAGG
ncbi:MAG TPA: M48 family metalloprotease [Rhizomicrobium sp.]|jgi:Zn-dependent protease with chaperone function|nr:M48 family metalloprotease [Rhizomicrobium sp.]